MDHFVSLSLVCCWWPPENTESQGLVQMEEWRLETWRAEASQHQGQAKHSQHCPMVLSM